jgi:RNA polymerase sigma-70 factor, ECF subfamily
MNKVNSDDRILVERTKRGDRSAFDQLVTKYQALAYQYAFRLTRDPEEAADIVSDCFIRMYKGLANFKGDSALTTWMYRISTNCYLDMRKKKRLNATVRLDTTVQTSEGEVACQLVDGRMSPHDAAVHTQEMSEVLNALKRLPEYQRAIILMYHAEMRSYEEIGESLDLPIGTVKSRLNRARLSLRGLLEPAPNKASRNLSLQSIST